MIERIDNMKSYTHGADIYTTAIELDINENAIIFPFIRLKLVIRPTPAGINKKDIWDIKISHISSIISTFIIPLYNPKKSIIRPNTVPGIGRLNAL